MVAIKLHVGEDIRRIVLEDDIPVAEQYARLLARIVDLYPELQGRPLRLAWRGMSGSAQLNRLQHAYRPTNPAGPAAPYRDRPPADEEGDAISVTTVGDFQEALAAFHRTEQSALRLFVLNNAVPALAPVASAPTKAIPPVPPAVPPKPASPPTSAAVPAPQLAPQPTPQLAPASAAEAMPEDDSDEEDNSADEAENDMGPPQFDSNGKRIHPFITCDGCQGPVAGIRYKCAQCYDFDLCEKCEATEQHPRHHVLLKIRVPQRVRIWATYGGRHGWHGRRRWRGPGGPGGPWAAWGAWSPWGFGPHGPHPHGPHGAHPHGPPPPFGGPFGSPFGGPYGSGCGWRRRGCRKGNCADGAGVAPADATATAAAPAAEPASTNATATAPESAESPYATQLRTLHEMGFVDDEANLELLRTRRGRLEDVIVGLTQLNMNRH